MCEQSHTDREKKRKSVSVFILLPAGLTRALSMLCEDLSGWEVVKGDVWQAACLPGKQPAGDGEVVPHRPWHPSALERRAGSCSMRYALPGSREEDIGGDRCGVLASFLAPKQGMAVREWCHHTAVCHGCSHTGRTCLPTYQASLPSAPCQCLAPCHPRRNAQQVESWRGGAAEGRIDQPNPGRMRVTVHCQ
jgi:hypothetical protein